MLAHNKLAQWVAAFSMTEWRRSLAVVGANDTFCPSCPFGPTRKATRKKSVMDAAVLEKQASHIVVQHIPFLGTVMHLASSSIGTHSRT